MARRYKSSRSRYSSRFFEPSRPIPAQGGIKAQSNRGAFGVTWWGKRWVQVTEASDVGARLSRGRTYARQGQILSLDILKERVEARVQGSRASAYKITIKVKPFTPAEWQTVARVLGAQALYSARLLAGELPEETENLLHKAGLSLFPEPGITLDHACSCPDWSNPCKHIAAILYLLAEELDRDPFLLFRLRGMERDEFLDLMKKSASNEAPESSPAVSLEKKESPQASSARPSVQGEKTRKRTSKKTLPESPPETESLPTDPGLFWKGQLNPTLSLAVGGITAPSVAAALPHRLGKISLWRGEERFLEAMEKIYATASPAGLDLLLELSEAEQ